jgi:hypothetical protein
MPLSELNGVPILPTPAPYVSKNKSSPPNRSFKTNGPANSVTQRMASKIYSEEMRQMFIRRLLKNLPMKQHVGKSVSIQYSNGEPMMSNPPYGFLPFALMSANGEIDKDYYRMFLFAQRQSLLAGVLTHLVKFPLA